MIEKHFFALVYASVACVTVARSASLCRKMAHPYSQSVHLVIIGQWMAVETHAANAHKKQRRTNPNIIELLKERLDASMRD